MITPTSVEPYMLHGVTPKVFSTHSRVRESIGSPVNESFSTPSRAPPASPEARSMRKTVGAAARGSGERRVGEEGRSRGSADHLKKKKIEKKHQTTQEMSAAVLSIIGF